MNKKRWLDLLNNLDEQKPITSEILANRLQISSKTVRNELKEIQSVLNKEGAHLYSKTNTGYLLKITDRDRYTEFLSSLKEDEKIPTNSLERVQFNVFQLEKLDLADYSYIISTVPIPFPVKRPILQIQMFFDEQDKRAVRKMLIEPDNFSVGKYFSPELFIPSLEASKKEEVIQQMVERIASVKNIPDCFLESVLKREKMAVTSFGNMVAIPHPHKAMTEETFVCIAVLKKPINWGNRKVQFVSMLSLKSPVDDNIQYLTKILSKLLFSPQYVNEIIQNPDYTVFMGLLNLIEKETGE